MNIKEKKTRKLLIVTVVIFVLAFIFYPHLKSLLDKVHTYYRPIHFGKEVMYSYIEEGDIRIADQIFENKYEVSRFSPTEIPEITWREDPYADIYWRFNFYNLQPVRDLLFAWRKTGDEKYKDRVIAIIDSFIDRGMNEPHSWDYHGVAFRTMTLIDVREKLLQENKLSKELDEKIVRALKVHGDFLANPNHFESDFNHGLDQAAALLLLSVNYPDNSSAQDWFKLSSERIVGMINGIVDEDGVLVENSPYYHVYVLEKIFEINKYLKENNIFIENFPSQKIDKMVSYMVHMLQPDLSVPLIGASISRQLGLAGMYKEIASERPDLLYVLTQGAYGDKPMKLNVQYPSSGETIMRSGWKKGKSYKNQTQIIFDVGNYRTDHSDLDALSFNLYGKGVALMPDAGLYSYSTEPYRTYFHGTRAHNTVVVDGKDQEMGDIPGNKKVETGSFHEGDGFVYQSAQHTLNPGVSHQRAIVLVEDSTIIVFDNLESKEEHSYEQMFHLFPGAKISRDGLTLTAKGDNNDQQLTIKQYLPEGVDIKTELGQNEPFSGWCSPTYNKAVPCESISYKKKGMNVSYVTSISLGKEVADIVYNSERTTLKIKTDSGNQYSIRMNVINGLERHIEVNKIVDTQEILRSRVQIKELSALIANDWVVSKSGTAGKILADVDNKILELKTPLDGSYLDVSKSINLDLQEKNLYFKIKVDQISSLQGIDISLSNNNWEKETVFNIEKIINYQNEHREGEWIQFGASKGELRKSVLGSWLIASWNKSDANFDWSKVDGIRFIAKAKQGEQSTLSIADFMLVPDQDDAKIVIIFDDGWASIMDVADLMKKYEMSANTAVITSAIGKKKYLSIEEIKKLQNEYGWNIANHSELHKNAVFEYDRVNDLAGFDNDTQNALQFLIQNKINSAPNWYIYPDGSTNEAVKKIIGKYYKFARATTIIPQPFPFPDPLEVGVFQVYSDRASVSDVYNAIEDAKKYKQTLFLMFHKISKDTPSVFTEYSIDNFESILKKIQMEKVKVVTLSELDRENNIPETIFTVYDAKQDQLSIDVSLERDWKNTIISNFLNIWGYIVGLRQYLL